MAGSGAQARVGKSFACSWPILSPSTIVITWIWAVLRASVEKREGGVCGTDSTDGLQLPAGPDIV